MNWFQRFIVNFACIFYPVKFYGLENIPEGGAVLVSNHLSLIDSLYLRKMYKKEMYFLAKKELFKKKCMAKLLGSFGAIPIDRDKPDIKSLLAAANVLRRDCKLLIFPEGTRNRTGTTELQPLKSGSVVLAVKAKKPIVPIIILKKAKIFRRNKMIIGEPFSFDEYYDTKITDEIIFAMDEIVKEKMTEQQQKLIYMANKSKKAVNEHESSNG